jgi:TonB-linked SusC/RagA family outer membrane protein
MRKLLMIVALCLTIAGFAQSGKVSGVVVNKISRSPVEGVTVTSPQAVTLTDQNGRFSVNTSKGESLTFTYIGMNSVVVKIADLQKAVNVDLEPGQNNLEAVVVTGYKTERKKDITGAVSVVNVGEATKESNANILTSLQGRIPGVVINNDGSPGGTGLSVVIRGFSTTGNNSPLYVIDGVPTTSASALSPGDIESIQVLKDASSATIYGARANSGVIIITTKKGKSQKTEINFTSYVGSQVLANKLNLLNTEQYGQALWQAYAYSGLTPSHSVYGTGATPVAAAFIDPGKTMATANTDWLEAIYNPSNIQSYNLGLNKAADKSSFYLGIDYVKDDGIQKYSKYDKFSTRLNSSFKLDNNITVGENLQVAYFRQVNFGTRAMNDALFQFPYIPLYDNLGNFAGPWAGDQSDKRNPLGELYNNRDNRSQQWRVFGNVYLDAAIVKGLTFKTSLAIDYSNSYQRSFAPTYVEGSHPNTVNSLTTSSRYSLSYTWTNSLNYHYTLRDHVFDLFAGVEAIKSRQESMSGTNTGFIINDYNYTFLGTATGIATAAGSASQTALMSQFAKFNYAYSDKYLFSATVRRDGSSRFGESNRYGVFPAFSAGWRLNNEKLFSQINAINELKLRGSWGQTGNQEIGDYRTVDFFSTSANNSYYNLVGTPTGAVPGYYASQLGNPNLKWESQTQTDIGLDFVGFNSHVSASIDWYKKITSNLLFNPALLTAAGGASAPFVNAGKIQNTGIEIALGYQNTSRSGLHWSADFNIAFNRNKVLELTPGVPYITNTYGRIEPGHPINEFYGYISDGIFRDQKEVDDYKAKVKTGDFQAKPGRLRYVDLDGNGVIDANDRTYIGNPNAGFNYGLNLSASYKGIDASVFVAGVSGGKIFNEFRKYSELGLFASNMSATVLDAWSTSNPNGSIPALQKTLTNNEGRTSTYFIEDGDYLKIRSIQIGYTIPKNVLAKIGIKNLRFYVQGQNLFNFTKYTGMDPESVSTGTSNKGVDFQGNLYPHSKAINFGLNLNF